MTALHLLAYLLTGNHEKAEQCFVTGLEDRVSNNSIVPARLVMGRLVKCSKQVKTFGGGSLWL